MHGCERQGLSRADAARRLDKARQAVPKDACWSCDCFQGFLTQLELDAAEDVTDLTDPLKVPREQMHGCLGCDPCPPGEAYSQYLRRGNCGCD